MHGRGVSASDLVASLSPRPQMNTSGGPTNGTAALSRGTTESGVPAATPQDYLLQLLNRKPAQETPIAAHLDLDVPKAASHSLAEHPIDDQAPQVRNDFSAAAAQKEHVQRQLPQQESSSTRNDSPIRIFGSSDSK